MEHIRQMIVLNQRNAAPFAPYLLPQAQRDLCSGRVTMAVGAVENGRAVGAVAASVDRGEMTISSLYVDRAVRRTGIGTALLEALSAALYKAGIVVAFVKTDYMVENQDGEEISAFLRSMEFDEPTVSNRLFSVDTARLHRLPMIGAAFSMNFREDPHVRPFAAITPAQLEEIEQDSEVPDYLKPSGMRNPVLRQASTIWVENDRVLAWLLCYQGFDGEIVMSAACKRSGAPDGSFRKLLQASANRCYLMLGRDFITHIATVNDHSASLVERITAGGQREHLCCSADTGDEPPCWISDCYFDYDAYMRDMGCSEEDLGDDFDEEVFNEKVFNEEVFNEKVFNEDEGGEDEP